MIEVSGTDFYIMWLEALAIGILMGLILYHVTLGKGKNE